MLLLKKIVITQKKFVYFSSCCTSYISRLWCDLHKRVFFVRPAGCPARLKSGPWLAFLASFWQWFWHPNQRWRHTGWGWTGVSKSMTNKGWWYDQLWCMTMTGVSRVFHRWLKLLSQFQGKFQGGFQGCFVKVSRSFHRSFKDLS